MIPPAATAVIRAAVEAAHRDGHTCPASMAERVSQALTAYGWTMTPACD